MLRTTVIPAGPAAYVGSDHYYLVDISGSMSEDLPGLRRDLKNNLAGNLRPGDTLTIIYYSTNGTYGYVLSDFSVTDIISLVALQSAIDTWLKPMSLTGFVDPLQLLHKHLVGRIATTDRRAQVMVFMSDGYENQNPRHKVLDACAQLVGLVDSATFVEYGNYANHGLLVEMADALGGTLIYAERLQDYTTLVAGTLRAPVPNQLVKITVPADVDFCFQIINDVPQVHRVVDGACAVRQSYPVYEVGRFSYEGGASDMELYATVYAALHARMPHLARQAMAQLSCVRTIDLFSGAIGKQRSNQFMAYLLTCVSDAGARLAQGKAPGYMPEPDAFCVLDLLDLLAADQDNVLELGHPDWVYRRGGVQRVSTSDLTFIPAATMPTASFADITRSTERANVGIRAKVGGTVDVSNAAGNTFGLGTIQTHIYRSYNIIRDGVLVVDKLPVRLTSATFKKMHMRGFQVGAMSSDGHAVLNIARLPVTNAWRVGTLDGILLCQLQATLTEVRGRWKALRHYLDQQEPERRSGLWVKHYGEEATAWLRSIGLTEANGFAPATEKGEPQDFYMAPVVKIKLKGLSSLPSVTSVEALFDAGKTVAEMKVAEACVAEGIEAWSSVETLTDPVNRLKAMFEDANQRKRWLEVRLANMVLTGLLAGGAFTGLDDQGQTQVTVLNRQVQATVVQEEEEVEV